MTVVECSRFNLRHEGQSANDVSESGIVRPANIGKMHLQRGRGRAVDGRGHIHSAFARQRSSGGCRLPGEGRFPTLIPKWLVVDWLAFAYNIKWSDSYQFELLLSNSFVENNATQNAQKHRFQKENSIFLGRGKAPVVSPRPRAVLPIFHS